MKQLFSIKKEADSALSHMSSKEKEKLEKKLDVEHAYYSSVLEGSMLDKGEFEKLGERIK